MTVVIQRPLRGSRISSFYPVKNLPSLSSLDSAFQLQEYISLLIRLDVHDVDAIVSIPGGAKSSSTGKTVENTSGNETSEGASSSEDKEKSTDSKKNEVTVDEPCWIYEQLRRLAQDLSHPLITMLQQECNRSTCPEMKAGEWLYLCVAHGNDGAMEQCCAIDYILHTIDSATALLNSPRAFPSRLQIPPTSHRHFSSLARRLGRIFAHAYFHHREAFEQAEAESSLYARFLALTSKFDLVPAEFLVIPPRADERDGDADREVQPPKLLAAGLNPSGSNTSQDPHSLQPQSGGPSGLSSTNPSRDGWPRNLQIERSKSNSPPHSGGDSPRRVGRSRTDTMVFSDASNIVEELAKAEEEHHSVPPVPKVPDSTSSEAPSLEASTPTEETASSEQPAAAATSSEEDTPAPPPADTSDITDELTHEPPSPSSSTTTAVEEEEHPISSSTPEEKEESSTVDDATTATTEPEETEQPPEPSASHEEAADVADAPTSHTEAEDSEADNAESEITEASEVVVEDKPVDDAATSIAPEVPESTTDAEVKTAEETPENSEAENKDQVAAEDVEDKPSTDVHVASEDKAEDNHSENTGEGDAKEPTAAAHSTSDSDKNSTEH